MDVDAERDRLHQLDNIDRAHTLAEAAESQRLAQRLRLVDHYGIDPADVEPIRTEH